MVRFGSSLLVLVFVVGGIAIGFAPSVRAPTFSVFFGGQPLWNVATGGATSVIDFDSNCALPTGGGVSFAAPSGGAALSVLGGGTSTPTTGWIGTGVPWALSTTGYHLLPTTGACFISPGGASLVPGPAPAIENDDLEVTFSPPVYGVGFDLLFQSIDSGSFIGVTVYSPSNAVLYSNGFIPTPACPPTYDPGCGGNPSGSMFVGFCSSPSGGGSGFQPIGRIVVDDFDSDSTFPDSNIGFDTFRIRAASGGMPTC